MKSKIILGAVLTFCLFHPAFGQGLLTPPGTPAPTMKTLAQIEPRTPISSVPFNITQSGSYYLTTNVTATVSNAIVISANNVTLDLGGWTIASSVAVATNGGAAILLTTNLNGITICNGHIVGGVTNSGSGVFLGSGFGNGIYAIGNPVNVRVTGVSVFGCLNRAIYLNRGDSTLVEACTVRTMGYEGINASTIRSSVATDCAATAINGDQVSDCRGKSTTIGTGIAAVTAENCVGNSATYIGLSAVTAINCSGYAAGNGAGLNATTALNCFGQSQGDYGISATTAQGCTGYSTSSNGIHVTGVAINCQGTSGSVSGISAFIASSCYSVGPVALSATHNINSF